MAKTVSTSAATLCPATEFTKRHDWRRIADLVSSSSSRTGDPTVPSTKSAVEAHDVVTSALLTATGKLLTAAQKGQRYTPADLAVLTGAGLNLLYSIISDLAFWECYKFRNPTSDKLLECYKDAQEFLQRLGLGERIFGFEETEEAGLPDHDQLTAVDICQQGLSTDNGARRYFGRRNKEERLGRSCSGGCGNC